MIKKTLCFSNPAYLSTRYNQLVIKLPEVENTNISNETKAKFTRTIPIEDIGIVLIDNKQITITSSVFELLLEQNAAIITCDSSHMPTGLLLPLQGNTIQSERYSNQINSSIPLKKQLWQQTIQYKIKNQAALLKELNIENRNMLIWADNVKSGDSSNLEARAAAYYWKNIFINIPNFIRDKDGEYPNNLLNYGYAILRAIVARSIVTSGMLPTLGIHHHNRYNAYCLADDIMEPYRPYIDKLVLKIISSKEDTEITNSDKNSLLNIPVLDVNINGKNSPLMVAVSLTTSSLYKCYCGLSRKIIFPQL